MLKFIIKSENMENREKDVLYLIEKRAETFSDYIKRVKDTQWVDQEAIDIHINKLERILEILTLR